MALAVARIMSVMNRESGIICCNKRTDFFRIYCRGSAISEDHACRDGFIGGFIN